MATLEELNIKNKFKVDIPIYGTIKFERPYSLSKQSLIEKFVDSPKNPRDGFIEFLSKLVVEPKFNAKTLGKLSDETLKIVGLKLLEQQRLTEKYPEAKEINGNEFYQKVRLVLEDYLKERDERLKKLTRNFDTPASRIAETQKRLEALARIPSDAITKEAQFFEKLTKASQEAFQPITRQIESSVFEGLHLNNMEQVRVSLEALKFPSFHQKLEAQVEALQIHNKELIMETLEAFQHSPFADHIANQIENLKLFNSEAVRRSFETLLQPTLHQQFQHQLDYFRRFDVSSILQEFQTLGQSPSDILSKNIESITGLHIPNEDINKILESINLSESFEKLSKEFTPGFYEDVTVNYSNELVYDGYTTTYDELIELIDQRIQEFEFTRDKVQDLEDLIQELIRVNQPNEKLLLFLIVANVLSDFIGYLIRVTVCFILTSVNPSCPTSIQEIPNPDSHESVIKSVRRPIEDTQSAQNIDIGSVRYVNGEDVNVREEDSIKSKIVDKLRYAYPVTVLAKSNNWLYVSYKIKIDNKEVTKRGWLYSEYLSIPEEFLP